MKFSVIIPVYNAEKYIDQSILSVLSQEYPETEIIFVDDGSTDQSGTICDAFNQKYPEIIKVVHQENQGQLVARCNGAKAAQGDYCLFLDADDALQDGCFQEMQAILKKFQCPDLVIFSFLYENPDGETRPAYKICEGEKLFTDKTELYQMFFTSTCLNNVWTKLIKRQTLARCEIDVEAYKNLRCAEDRLQAMEMVTKAESVVYTDRPWYRYRLVADSVTRQFTPEAISRFNSSMLYGVTRDYLRQWNLPLPEWQERMDAEWAGSFVYVFDRFYTRCPDKNSIWAYAWEKHLPPEVRKTYSQNPFINEVKKKYVTWILGKKKLPLAFYVWKRETRKKLKQLLKGK